MKRRKFLLSLGLLPMLLQAASCKKRFPDAATIIKGRITDEQGNPVEGIRMVLAGTKPSSFSKTVTFEVRDDSDHNGEYLLSHVITKGSKTRVVDLFYEHNFDLPFSPTSYGLYTVEDNKLVEQAIGFYIIGSDKYGKTTTINLHFKGASKNSRIVDLANSDYF